MILYRPHRGSLDEAMRSVIEVFSFDQLVRHMRREVHHMENIYPADDLPTVDNTKLEHMGLDERIGWDTYLVTVNGKAWGYTNGVPPLGDETDLDKLGLYLAHLAHVAGFLEGLSKRAEALIRWNSGETDVGGLRALAEDCRTYSANLRKLSGVKLD